LVGYAQFQDALPAEPLVRRALAIIEANYRLEHPNFARLLLRERPGLHWKISFALNQSTDRAAFPCAFPANAEKLPCSKPKIPCAGE
jgi:hypothetical protein